jgi:hypothetical protein
MIDAALSLEDKLPLKAANKYMGQKRAARWQNTTCVNKFITYLQQCIDNPGSAGSITQLQSERSSVASRRIILEALLSKSMGHNNGTH